MRFSGVRELVLQSLLLWLTVLSAAALLGQGINPSPLSFAGITVDRLSALLTLLVGFVGSVTFWFSLRYLDGEPRKKSFLNVLFVTVCAAYLFMLSTHLILLFAAWTLTSLGLHRLLTFYPDRPESLPPAKEVCHQPTGRPGPDRGLHRDLARLPDAGTAPFSTRRAG